MWIKASFAAGLRELRSGSAFTSSFRFGSNATVSRRISPAIAEQLDYPLMHPVPRVEQRPFFGFSGVRSIDSFYSVRSVATVKIEKSPDSVEKLHIKPKITSGI